MAPPPYLGGEGRKVPPPRGTRKDLDKVPPSEPPRVVGRREGRVGREGSGNQTRPGVGRLDPTLLGTRERRTDPVTPPKGFLDPWTQRGLPQ